MKIYSDFPARRAAQVVADVLALLAIALGVWLGFLVGGTIAVLAGVGRQLESAGEGFAGAMSDAGEALGRIPLVGDAVRAPFDAAGGTGVLLENAGRSTASLVTTVSLVVGVLVAVLVGSIVLWVWLRRRLRSIRRATQAAGIARLDGGTDILALRALVAASRRDLASVGRDPVGAWRAGEVVVIGRLAELELRGAGVRLGAAR